MFLSSPLLWICIQERQRQNVMFENETITILEKFDPCIKILI